MVVKNQWLAIRRDLLEKTKRKVQLHLGLESGELKEYSQEFKKEFKKKWKVSSKKELIEGVLESQIVYISDFHAFAQSQKVQRRILEALPPKREIVLAVEFFEARHQEKVEKFLQGRLAEKAFLKGMQWEERWGFSWENYKPLIQLAKKRKIPVYGLNQFYRKRTKDSLHKRDVFAAKKIKGLIKKYPEAIIFVIYGDLHLASSHLPFEVEGVIGKKIKTLSVFQNSEEIYFQLAKQDLEFVVDVVRMRKNQFCVMGAPPWVKWQSYLMSLEQSFDLDLDEERQDYTEHVSNFAQVICQDLKIDVDTNDLGIYTSGDHSLFRQMQVSLSPAELKIARILISDEKSFFIPERGVGFLSRSTINHAAYLAGLYVHSKMSKWKRLPWKVPNDFLQLIWVETVAYFLSKLINHKRKTETVYDLQMMVNSQEFDEGIKEALLLALDQKMQEVLWLRGKKGHREKYIPRHKVSYWEAAKLLGGMNGERLYNGYRKKVIESQLLINWLVQDIEKKDFQSFYLGVLQALNRVPAPFRSKKEKM